jgi:hypothetical protein
MAANYLLLTGRLAEAANFERSASGRLFAKARIAIGSGKGASVVPIIFGGEAAEVLSTVMVGESIMVRGRVHGHRTSKNNLIALICAERVVLTGKRGAATC